MLTGALGTKEVMQTRCSFLLLVQCAAQARPPAKRSKVRPVRCCLCSMERVLMGAPTETAAGWTSEQIYMKQNVRASMHVHKI